MSEAYFKLVCLFFLKTVRDPRKFILAQEQEDFREPVY